jgi:chemotaxis protein MotB
MNIAIAGERSFRPGHKDFDSGMKKRSGEGFDMMNYIRIGIAVLAAGLIVSGCVSSAKYKKLETDKNQEISALQQEKAAAEKDNADLKQQVASLEQQKAAAEQEVGSLQQQKSAVETQKSAAEQQVGSLQQQNASLIAASRQQQQQYQSLVNTLLSEVQKGQVQVKQYQNMLTVELAEQVFFDSGRATLKPEGQKVLKDVGEALKGFPDKIIRVVGHTDNKAIKKSLQATFPSNWELSVARATTVVRFLQKIGVPPEYMIACVRAEYQPIAPYDTPENRQKNLRIEIMLIDKNLLSEMSVISHD